jgi:hypothetical protein
MVVLEVEVEVEEKVWEEILNTGGCVGLWSYLEVGLAVQSPRQNCGV